MMIKLLMWHYCFGSWENKVYLRPKSVYEFQTHICLLSHTYCHWFICTWLSSGFQSNVVDSVDSLSDSHTDGGSLLYDRPYDPDTGLYGKWRHGGCKEVAE